MFTLINQYSALYNWDRVFICVAVGFHKCGEFLD